MDKFTTLKNAVESEIADLDIEDATGHVYWQRFHNLLEEVDKKVNEADNDGYKFRNLKCPACGEVDGLEVATGSDDLGYASFKISKCRKCKCLPPKVTLKRN